MIVFYVVAALVGVGVVAYHVGWRIGHHEGNKNS